MDKNTHGLRERRETLFGIDNYLGFIAAGILLNMVPGADTIYILTRSIAQGKKAGIFSVLGISSGILVHTLLAAFGLSVILSTSVALYNVIKFLGVFYLVYLGVRMIVTKNELTEVDGTGGAMRSMKKLYSQGLITNVLNPKVALFFISFLPQFIQTDQNATPVPFLILGLTFIATSTLWCFLLVFASAFMSRSLRNNRKRGDYLQKISGSVIIALAARLAFDRT